VFPIKTATRGGSGAITVEMVCYYCETENEAVCRIRPVRYEIPFSVDECGRNRVTVTDNPKK